MTLMQNSEVVARPWISTALGDITACFTLAQGHTDTACLDSTLSCLIFQLIG